MRMPRWARWVVGAALLLAGLPASAGSAQRRSAAKALLAGEAIGGVRMGMTPLRVIAQLGKPSRVWKRNVEHDGSVTIRWWWEGHAAEMLFCGASVKTVSVCGLEIVRPSRLTTSKGIGIGSTLRDLDAAYGAGHDPRPEDNGMYVVGEEGGLAFDVGFDKTVDAIYWGRDTGP
ncbi:hypothetical protein [Labilithrix luteola]|uniref:hypothetical protein n=1 Tax=Labilithrix luteola TaxID=1391654 RepID=UPI0011BAA8D5|nr:hypothetical protein [Labilithrix luteola]